MDRPSVRGGTLVSAFAILLLSWPERFQLAEKGSTVPQLR